MPDPKLAPRAIAAITLVAGAALTARPEKFCDQVGLDHTLGVRAVGVADLILVPGLATGEPRWPWMMGRAALSVMQAAYLDGVAPRATSPGPVKAAAGVLAGLAVADLATAVVLRRTGD